MMHYTMAGTPVGDSKINTFQIGLMIVAQMGKEMGMVSQVKILWNFLTH